MEIFATLQVPGSLDTHYDNLAQSQRSPILFSWDLAAFIHECRDLISLSLLGQCAVVLELKVSENIEIRQGCLHIGSTLISTYRLTRELPAGANGRVFVGEHGFFGHCVVKLWLRKKKSWKARFEQGLAEVRKTASANPKWVVRIFDAQLVGNVFLCSMQLLQGKTLNSYLKESLDEEFRWRLAEQYVEAIFATRDTIHGDAHAKNVMVSEDVSDGKVMPRLTLIDFGASWFFEGRSSKGRHWKVVQGTVRDIVKKLPKFSRVDRQLLTKRRVEEDEYRQLLDRLRPLDVR